MKRSPWLIILASAALISCGGGNKYSDLDTFFEETRAKPSGQIPPVPALQAYRAFTYSASGLRSPFSRPVDVKEIERIQASQSVKPDDKREKEFLESFSIDSLKMVGTINRKGERWALVSDPDRGIHRVRVSNYLGRNHGKIIEIGENYISVLEIVSNGGDGWVERPRSLELATGK
ncbi:pilus assembly protein PilP [Spongiibacter sp. KMU-158]|uniref:Pilus assembly protein PilP n=1 Tax=Spongiibacter pelagi TaxID=2760804 RepID=A0A927GVE0_9GAMM|nr:pilus assembly protein PilP [Spongiibacter pelagi]MBD2857973.1 pilus assembly protein PilP [Spongiibacter pelagi]